MDGINKYLLNCLTSYLVGSKRHLTWGQSCAVSHRLLSIHSCHLHVFRENWKCRARQGAGDPERSCGTPRVQAERRGFVCAPCSRPDHAQPPAARASEPVDRLGRSRLGEPPDALWSSSSPSYARHRATRAASPRFRPLLSRAGESPQRGRGPAGHVATHRPR